MQHIRPMNQTNEPFQAAISKHISDKKRRNFTDLMRYAYKEFDSTISQAMNTHSVKVDCCSGCSYCCELKVDVSAVEALYLASAVQSMDQASQERIKKRAAERHAFIQEKSEMDLLGINYPCPLLHDGACSAYHARPFFCRSFHAQTVETCKYSHESPADLGAADSQHVAVVVAAEQSRQTFKGEIAKAGLDCRTYDLGAAVHEALNTKAEKRFRDGKSAFSRLSLTPN